MSSSFPPSFIRIPPLRVEILETKSTQHPGRRIALCESNGGISALMTSTSASSHAVISFPAWSMGNTGNVSAVSPRLLKFPESPNLNIQPADFGRGFCIQRRLSLIHFPPTAEFVSPVSRIALKPPFSCCRVSKPRSAVWISPDGEFHLPTYSRSATLSSFSFMAFSALATFSQSSPIGRSLLFSGVSSSAAVMRM